jgi:hypothetical protein
VVESQATKNFELGAPETWRKAKILVDTVLGLVCEDSYSGNMLIDDEYLRDRQGFQDADFVQYRVDPNVEPPRTLALEAWGTAKKAQTIRRGDVKTLGKENKKHPHQHHAAHRLASVIVCHHPYPYLSLACHPTDCVRSFVYVFPRPVDNINPPNPASPANPANPTNLLTLLFRQGQGRQLQ